MDVYTRLRKRTFCTQIDIYQSSQIKTKPTAIKCISRGLYRYRSLVSTSPASHSTKVRDSSRPSAPTMPPSHCPYLLRLYSPAFIRKRLSCLCVCVKPQSYRQSPHLHICTSSTSPNSTSPPLRLPTSSPLHLFFISPPLRLSISPSLQIPIFPHLHLSISPLSLPPILFSSPHLPRPQPLKPTNPKPAHPPPPPSPPPLSHLSTNHTNKQEQVPASTQANKQATIREPKNCTPSSTPL